MPLTNHGTGSDLRIGIVHARWNEAIIKALVDGAKKTLLAAGVKEQNITVQSVPGSYELPFATQRYISSPSTPHYPTYPQETSK